MDAATTVERRRGVCTPHPGTLNATAAFGVARSLDVFCIMSQRHGKRKLAVFRLTHKLDASAYTAFVAALSTRIELQLEAVPVELLTSSTGTASHVTSCIGAASLLIFHQRNSLSSRKQVAPIFAEELRIAYRPS